MDTDTTTVSPGDAVRGDGRHVAGTATCLD